MEFINRIYPFILLFSRFSSLPVEKCLNNPTVNQIKTLRHRPADALGLHGQT